MTIEGHELAHRRQTAGMWMGAAAILFWATSTACVLWIGRQVGVWQYLAINGLIAAGGQVALYSLLGRSPQSLFVMPLRLWAAAVLGFVLYAVCFTLGMITAASNAQATGVSLMNYLWPVLTVLCCLFLVPGSRMNARLGVALAISFLGLAIANWDAISQARLHDATLPYLLGGLAGCLWALYSALISRWRAWSQRYATAPSGFLMISMLGAAVCLAKGEWRAVDARTWMALLYSGLVPHAAGYMLWELALHRAPATKLGLMGAATPVLSTLGLFLLFAVTGHSGTLPAQWGILLTGATLIAAAVLVVSVEPRPKA
jgi:drug/metabolite transporter (DMT)-like permease